MSNLRWINYFILAACFGCFANVGLAQKQEVTFSDKPPEVLKASSITWKAHFGGRAAEPKNMYCLMTQGAFRAPTSEKHEKLITDWLAKHPNANAIVVFIIEGALRDYPDSKLKSVWIVDADESLNLDLVRQGDCPAGTMVLNPGDKSQVSRKDYEAFEKKVWEAEEQARKEKIGIWSKDR